MGHDSEEVFAGQTLVGHKALLGCSNNSVGDVYRLPGNSMTGGDAGVNGNAVPLRKRGPRSNMFGR